MANKLVNEDRGILTNTNMEGSKESSRIAYYYLSNSNKERKRIN